MTLWSTALRQPRRRGPSRSASQLNGMTLRLPPERPVVVANHRRTSDNSPHERLTFAPGRITRHVLACFLSVPIPQSGGMHHPWREFGQRWPDWEIKFVMLPDGVCGETDRELRTIWIDKRLGQAERRSTIAHEAEHVARRDIVCDERDEEAVEHAAASCCCRSTACFMCCRGQTASARPLTRCGWTQTCSVAT